MISTPLQALLNVDSGKQRFPDGGSSMISGFIELMSNSFGENWTIQMFIQFSSNLGGSSPMLSSKNAFYCTSVPVGKYGSPAGITPVTGSVSVLLEFRHDHRNVISRKIKQFQSFC